MTQLQSDANVAPLDPMPASPAAGNGGVFLFSLLLACILGGFFAFPALTAKGEYTWKWFRLIGENALPLGSVIFLCLCAISAVALLVFGLFVRSTLRGTTYAILGLAGIGTMAFITLSGEGILAGGVITKATVYLPDFSKIILGTSLQPQIQLLFVMGIALLFSVMIGAARARVLFPDNGSSKAWSAITALGLLAIVTVPVLIYKTYETWNQLIPLKWASSGKDLMDLAALVIAAELTLLLIFTSVLGLGGGRSSRGRGVFIMGIGMAIAVILPVYFYLTQVSGGKAVLLTQKFTDVSGNEAWKWIMAQKQIFLAGASVWAFFAMVGLGIGDLICQDQMKKLATVDAEPEPIKVTPTAENQPDDQANCAETPNPQQKRLEEIKKLYNAGLLSEGEFNRRRDEITNH